jgi:hypothetical protein
MLGQTLRNKPLTRFLASPIREVAENAAHKRSAIRGCAMEPSLRDWFATRWKKYFDGAELPITFYYTDREEGVQPAKPPVGHRCIIAALSQVRRGKSLRFDAGLVGCGGARRYLGFSEEIMPDFEYFLSTGLPGKVLGERYKKSPALVKEMMGKGPVFNAPAKFIVFKRWDALEEADDPEVVIFFAPPDVISGLFTLANFDEIEPNGVFSPFAAGCGSIVQYPYLERNSERPRAVLGLFDVSARPHVLSDVFTFSVPMKKFRRMIENMEASFLVTSSWEKVKKRMG